MSYRNVFDRFFILELFFSEKVRFSKKIYRFQISMTSPTAIHVIPKFLLGHALSKCHRQIFHSRNHDFRIYCPKSLLWPFRGQLLQNDDMREWKICRWHIDKSCSKRYFGITRSAVGLLIEIWGLYLLFEKSNFFRKKKSRMKNRSNTFPNKYV